MNEFPMVLGAAQLGMAYGIANRQGQPSDAQTNEILVAAWQAGVRTIDTAASYGESEARIGQFLARRPECPFEIVTKLAGQTDSSDSTSIRASVETSIERLRQTPHAILLHKASDLSVWDEGLGETLEAIRSERKCDVLGVSIYSPEEFEEALRIPAMQYIQIPMNVFDQRWQASGLLEKAASLDRTIMIRSVFLQGLLLMSPEEARAGLPEAMDWIAKWRSACQALNRRPESVAIAYARAMAPHARLVLGAETAEQVRANAALILEKPLSDSEVVAFSDFAAVPPTVYDPRLWPKR